MTQPFDDESSQPFCDDDASQPFFHVSPPAVDDSDALPEPTNVLPEPTDVMPEPQPKEVMSSALAGPQPKEVMSSALAGPTPDLSEPKASTPQPNNLMPEPEARPPQLKCPSLKRKATMLEFPEPNAQPQRHEPILPVNVCIPILSDSE